MKVGLGQAARNNQDFQKHQRKEDYMPVIARFCGIVIRLLTLQSFGTRLHAFHGDSELVVDLASLRIIDGTVPAVIQDMILAWAKAHQTELLSGWWRGLPQAHTELEPAT